LKRRYEKLVAAHSNSTQTLAAGAKALPDGTTAFAQTQALWRFLSNERITPADLAEPLRAVAHTELASGCDHHALCVHDWSRINYHTHTGKRDRVQMTHATDVGYELQSSLLVSDRDGLPLVAPVQNLVTAAGVWQSRAAGIQPGALSHLDELTERVEWLENQGLNKPLVHIVDREADSVAHLRRWSQRGWCWLIRAREGARVRHAGCDRKLREVAAGLAFNRECEVVYKGHPAQQWLASAEVYLTRKAKPAGRDAQGKRLKREAGEALRVRLVVSRIHDAAGGLMAQWVLLTNATADVSDAQVALWYYYRWRIESYFKLLKAAGHQLESWEQETGQAVLKRLLIAGQACVLVWRLMRAQGEHAERTRSFLVRLSGRQMKRTRPVTAPALLDGLYKLFAMLETLHHYSLDDLEEFANFAFPRKPLPGMRHV
jgi:hypothetical protein